MRIPTHFSTSIVALALTLMCTTPAQSQIVSTGQPSPPAQRTTQTDTSAAARLRVADSIAMRRAIDSATRRAIDSATRRVLDSARVDAQESQRQWFWVIVGLLVLSGTFLGLFVNDMLRGHDVLVESHWGGFGGGVGGTRLSRALVLAVLLLLTSGMLTAVAVAGPGHSRTEPGTGTPKDSTRDTSTARGTTSSQRTSGSVLPGGTTIPDRSPGASGRGNGS